MTSARRRAAGRSARSSAWTRRRLSPSPARIGTLETSILPYEDCCTVFTPKHPKTKPTLAAGGAGGGRSWMMEALINPGLWSKQRR